MDCVISESQPKHLSPKGSSLDIRAFYFEISRMPLLLVSAARKSGSAIERNKFRRRARMAFLTVLRRCPELSGIGFVFWIRPTRGSPKGCRVDYWEIEKQMESSLGRMRHQ